MQRRQIDRSQAPKKTQTQNIDRDGCLSIPGQHFNTFTPSLYWTSPRAYDHKLKKQRPHFLCTIPYQPNYLTRQQKLRTQLHTLSFPTKEKVTFKMKCHQPFSPTNLLLTHFSETNRESRREREGGRKEERVAILKASRAPSTLTLNPTKYALTCNLLPFLRSHSPLPRIGSPDATFFQGATNFRHVQCLQAIARTRHLLQSPRRQSEGGKKLIGARGTYNCPVKQGASLGGR